MGGPISHARRLGRGNHRDTFAFYRLPRQQHKHLKSTNMLERLNEEIKRRTHVVRIFHNAQGCQRLVRALAVETHENWLEAHCYLNMNDLRELKRPTSAKPHETSQPMTAFAELDAQNLTRKRRVLVGSRIDLEQCVGERKKYQEV